MSIRSAESLSTRHILRTWWPLAASWMLMSFELPAIAAVIARLANPEINLAAYGSIVFPIALIVESPIIMLLTASTALSKDAASYFKLRKFMLVTGVSLTAVHILLAFTPLYYILANDVLGAPPDVVEPARIGLMVLTPWTISIAHRRFNQGVLIRFGHSHAVGQGTLIRLLANIVVLTVGYASGAFPGAVVGAATATAGVICEALYIARRVKPVVRDQLLQAPAIQPPLTFAAMMHFYIPLSMTSLIGLIAAPIVSASLSRMPMALPSLAVWPVVVGLAFFLRSFGFAYNEVVVALLDQPQSIARLRRFMLLLATATTAVLLMIVSTPLARLWFEQISGLTEGLARFAEENLWLIAPLPALTALQSWYQGIVLSARRTRVVTEAVAVYLLSNALLLSAGVWSSTMPGLYVGLAAVTIGSLAQTLWLWFRSRSVLRAMERAE